jgi:hypothetical protein
MPTIFSNRAGAVVQLDDPAVQCTTRLLSFGRNGRLSDGIAFQSEQSIVTRLTVSEQSNLQFLHTLGSQIFIYAFGDRIGQIGLAGLSFACACPDDGSLGIEKMLLWYRARRAAKRQTPVRVIIGRQAIEGFVTQFSAEVVDPSMNLTQWAVQLASLPGED